MSEGFLRKISLFSSLSEEILSDIGKHLEEHTYAKGERIFQEGDRADRLYLMFDGKVKVFKLSPDGKEHTLRIMQKYDVIGEVPMFSGDFYPANCEVLSSSKLYSISRLRLLDIIRSNPHVAFNMLAIQAKRLREFSLKIEKLTLKNTEQRLADFLIKKYDALKDGQCVLDFSDVGMQDLANYLDISRENVSRIIGKWVKLGLIDKNRNSITVLRYEVLKDIMAD